MSLARRSVDKPILENTFSGWTMTFIIQSGINQRLWLRAAHLCIWTIDVGLLQLGFASRFCASEGRLFCCCLTLRFLCKWFAFALCKQWSVGIVLELFRKCRIAWSLSWTGDLENWWDISAPLVCEAIPALRDCFYSSIWGMLRLCFKFSLAQISQRFLFP